MVALLPPNSLNSQKNEERTHSAGVQVDIVTGMPATSATAAASAAYGEQQPPLLVLEDVVRDAHMQSLFLQHLSMHDKKGFARLLFLCVCVYMWVCSSLSAGNLDHSLF